MSGKTNPDVNPKALPPDVVPDGGNVSAQSAARGYGDGYGYGYGYGAGTKPDGDSDLTLVHYLQILYRRRYLAATIFFVVVVAVTLNAVTSPRIYQSTAQILIERENPNVVSFQEVVRQNELTDDYYETQYRLLQSRALARRTIESTGLWSDPRVATQGRPSLFGLVRRYGGMATNLFRPAPPTPSPDASESAAESAAIDAFLGNLTVSAVRYSRLVDVSFQSEDPVLAARVANALAREYITQSLELRSGTTKEAYDFLSTQLAEQRAKLEVSERALQTYREKTDFVTVEERQNIVVQRLADLNAAATRANAARIQKEAAYNQVREALSNPAVIDTVPVILANTFVQQQKNELAQLQRQRAQLSEKLGPNHPDMVTVNLAIESAETRLKSEIAQIAAAMRNDYEAALAEENSITGALNRQKQDAQALNRAGIEYRTLERDSTANRQMFESLLQRTQETGVSEQLKTGNIRIVDPAEIPARPTSPNILNSVLLAVLGGLVLAVGVAFTAEYADDRLKNPDELKKHLGLPLLGMIPAVFDKSVSTPLITARVPAVFTESVRSIRTNVLFSSTDDGGRMVVVTSSVPGEGKTVVSTNLATAMAQAGHRVLLVDADMRKPRVHDVFGHAMTPGLSNLLVGNATASETIHEAPTQGLWVISAGTPPPNPAELLGSKRFKDFMVFLQSYFDWVIVDTPPVMAVTDAAIVANLAHGVLFVVGAEMTSWRVAKRAVEQLQIGQVRFLGTVLNRVNLERNAYYYSRYGHGQYYGGYHDGPPSGGGAADLGEAENPAWQGSAQDSGTWAARAVASSRGMLASAARSESGFLRASTDAEPAEPSRRKKWKFGASLVVLVGLTMLG